MSGDQRTRMQVACPFTSTAVAASVKSWMSIAKPLSSLPRRNFMTLVQGEPVKPRRRPIPSCQLSLHRGQIHHDNATSPRRTALLPQWRMFSLARTTQAAIVNPRKDEQGNEMNVEITPRASHRLKEIMSKDSNPNLLLRVTVESGGCHGFQYLMSLTDTSALSPEDDTVFESGDGTGAKVVMDEPSLDLLKGSKIDYTMELIGSQFKIVDNPLATSSCGCGTSFDIKA